MKTNIKDSGKKQEFTSGAHRDCAIGKGRCDLLPLDCVSKVMNDPTIANINTFLETKDNAYLVAALKCSLNTLNIFNYINIQKELQDLGISLAERNTKEEENTAILAHIILEVSKHYEDGANKYGENNWKLGMPVERYIDSCTRHYLKALRGDLDEPHYRAFVWNLLCAMWTQEHLYNNK